ncbi:MAG: methyl-accepting chemotaxis protein [Chitinispirillia bacterium]|jgi:hypothetical protein
MKNKLKLHLLIVCLCLGLLFLLLSVKGNFSNKQEVNRKILNLVKEQKILSDRISILLHVFHANREDRSAATKSIIRLESTMNEYDKTNYTLMKYMKYDPKMALLHGNREINYPHTLSENPNGITAKKLWFDVKKDINKVIKGGNGTILLLENIIVKNEKIRWELNNILNIFQKKYENENNFINFIQFSIFLIGIIISISLFFIMVFMLNKKSMADSSGKKHFGRYVMAKHTKYSIMENYVTNNRKDNLFIQQNSCENELIYNMLSAAKKLKQSSNQVELIQKIVNDMVFQLNLISLNTAVELENLGYSKTELNNISNEIRNLSEKSVDDAKTVLEIINNNITDTELVLNIAESIAESTDHESI